MRNFLKGYQPILELCQIAGNNIQQKVLQSNLNDIKNNMRKTKISAKATVGRKNKTKTKNYNQLLNASKDYINAMKNLNEIATQTLNEDDNQFLI